MKKLIPSLLALVLVLALLPAPANALIPWVRVGAAGRYCVTAADSLHTLGLFQGVGTDADGNPDFDLARSPTRAEAVTMLVRLLGKEDEAKSGNWDIPFTDVADWAKPYVGYAYAHGLTNGMSTTTFGSSESVTTVQFLTFLLRALGYDSNTDFMWDRPWPICYQNDLTANGLYTAGTKIFTRGDVAYLSHRALTRNLKGQDTTLIEALMAQGVAHTHDWATRHVDEYGYKEPGTHQELVSTCHCGSMFSSGDPDCLAKWYAHNDPIVGCTYGYTQGYREVSNDRRPYTPAHDEIYCTICGTVQ